ncbi:MAG: aminotransferase class V-fold PLP-dependent enzyme, partial [Caulobacterales bacterium]
MTASRIYADYNAQSPLRPEARAAVERVMATFGNPSSVHGEGRRAKAILDDARDVIANSVGANAGDLIFTSGAAEANNLAIFGGAKASGASAIFLSQLEHDSVWRAANATGLPVFELPVTLAGVIDLNWLASRLEDWDLLRDGRPFACVMLANNETGIIQPVAEAAAFFHGAGGYLLCDAVQGLGRIAIDIENL